MTSPVEVHTMKGKRLSRNPETLDDGKEDSYERNPGRVSFVFNHKFFCAQTVQKNLQQLVEKNFFDKLNIQVHKCFKILSGIFKIVRLY